MPSVCKRGRLEQMVESCTEHWKTRFVNLEFPWLWAVRQDWKWSEETSLVLKAEILEKSDKFQIMLNLRTIPAGELWVHHFWGDGREGVNKVAFSNTDWNRRNALIDAIWASTPFLVHQLAIVEEETAFRRVTVLYTKFEWGFNQALRMMRM